MSADLFCTIIRDDPDGIRPDTRTANGEFVPFSACRYPNRFETRKDLQRCRVTVDDADPAVAGLVVNTAVPTDEERMLIVVVNDIARREDGSLDLDSAKAVFAKLIPQLTAKDAAQKALLEVAVQTARDGGLKAADAETLAREWNLSASPPPGANGL